MTDSEVIAGFVFQFPAVIDSWHDGDTCSVHRGAKPDEVVHGEKVRVQGINAPELSKAGGAEARDYAIFIAPPGTRVTRGSGCGLLDMKGTVMTSMRGGTPSRDAFPTPREDTPGHNPRFSRCMALCGVRSRV